MCLILVAWQARPDYPLVVAANRDEFFARPAAATAWWPEAPDLFAGRDLEAGGTWLGLSRHGRFAALTNFRDPARVRPGTPSRGALVADFLQGRESTDDALARLAAEGPRYNGFNLLLSDGVTLGVFESEADSGRRAGRRLAPGLYALSNHLLDTPWPKVVRGKARLADWLAGPGEDPEPLFDLLGDRALAAEADLPRTGVPLDWERRLSAAFIVSPEYGTRCSTVLILSRDGWARFHERTFGADGRPTGEVHERFRLSPP